MVGKRLQGDGLVVVLVEIAKDGEHTIAFWLRGVRGGGSVRQGEEANQQIDQIKTGRL